VAARRHFFSDVMEQATHQIGRCAHVLLGVNRCRFDPRQQGRAAMVRHRPIAEVIQVDSLRRSLLPPNPTPVASSRFTHSLGPARCARLDASWVQAGLASVQGQDVGSERVWRKAWTVLQACGNNGSRAVSSQLSKRTDVSMHAVRCASMLDGP
jgi:hypothetical protein